jgi:cytochrome c-type biogenesis protein CcmE
MATSTLPNSTPVLRPRPAHNRAKFLIGFGLILAAIVYLIVSNTLTNAQSFYTIQELQQKGAPAVGRSLRVTGAVIGESIQYDVQTLTLTFTAVHTPVDAQEIQALGGLAEVLHLAVNDPTAARLTLMYVGPKPDLIKNEAQVIAVGRLGEDGIFYADEVTFKCPTRYEEAAVQNGN